MSILQDVTMNLKIIMIAILFVLGFSGIAEAEIYKWIDDKGKVHFGDAPPSKEKAEQIDEEELAKRFSSYTQVSVKMIPIDFGINRQTNMLLMYTTTRCSYCAKARKYFAAQGIDYVEKNIEMSDEYRQEFKRAGGKGVPLIFFGRYQMTGFSEARFKNMYAGSRP